MTVRQQPDRIVTDLMSDFYALLMRDYDAAAYPEGIKSGGDLRRCIAELKDRP